MSRMRAFTNDVESTELSAKEMKTFGQLVKFACYPDLQERLSLWLARIKREQSDSVSEGAARQVQRMWRTESRM